MASQPQGSACLGFSDSGISNIYDDTCFFFFSNLVSLGLNLCPYAYTASILPAKPSFQPKSFEKTNSSIDSLLSTYGFNCFEFEGWFTYQGGFM